MIAKDGLHNPSLNLRPLLVDKPVRLGQFEIRCEVMGLTGVLS